MIRNVDTDVMVLAVSVAQGLQPEDERSVASVWNWQEFSLPGSLRNSG